MLDTINTVSVEFVEMNGIIVFLFTIRLAKLHLQNIIVLYNYDRIYKDSYLKILQHLHKLNQNIKQKQTKSKSFIHH